MNVQSKFRLGRLVVYAILIAAIVWQGYRVLQRRSRIPAFRHRSFAVVHVDGNVERPGRYRVPDGTSRFELLQAAGLRSTSDITMLNLTEQIEEEERVNVGTLSSPAGLTSGRLSARLEFFLGDISIESREGTPRPSDQAGMYLVPGDVVNTDSTSQAEISVGPYTRIDIDNASQVAFDQIAAREGERTVTTVYQKEGTAWYRVVYTSKDERFKIVTGSAVVMPVGTGSDFMVEINPNAVRVHTLEGLLLVERPEGEEVLNLVAGQTLTVFGNRPFQITRTASDVSPNRQFAQLQRDREERRHENMPVNFVFCTLPHSYFLISVRFDRRDITVVSIPAQTSVEQFARGFSTLNESYLLGGTAYVETLVEQLVGTRVERHFVLEPQGLLQLVSAIGGLTLTVDTRAAQYMNVPPGPQHLDAQQVYTFMKPQVSGPADSKERQKVVLEALFKVARSRQVSLTTALAEKAVSVMQTDFTISEISDSYSRFTSRQGWAFKTVGLPGNPMQIGGKSIFAPNVDEARRLLFTES